MIFCCINLFFCCINLIIIYLFIFYVLSFLVSLFTDFEFLARLLVKEVPQVTQDISEVTLIDDVISHDMFIGHVFVYLAEDCFGLTYFLFSVAGYQK